MKYLVTISTKAFTTTLIERENPTGEGWNSYGFPVLTPDEIKQAGKDFRSDCDVQTQPEDLAYFLEVEEVEPAGPEHD